MKASVKHIRISPKKANLVAGLVRGKSAEEALTFLKFANKKGADILYKVVASAVANAENNDAKSKDNLVLSSVVVTKGRTLRRGIPASRGRVAPIKKRSSHLFVELSEIISVPTPEPKSKTIASGEEEKPKAVEEKAEKKDAKPKKKPAAKKPAAAKKS